MIIGDDRKYKRYVLIKFWNKIGDVFIYMQGL